MCPLTHRALEIIAMPAENLISLDFNDFGFLILQLPLQNSACGI